jgi:hypothetical protein
MKWSEQFVYLLNGSNKPENCNEENEGTFLEFIQKILKIAKNTLHTKYV